MTRLIRMIPEHFVDLPLWENGVPVEPGDLPFSADLASALTAWNDEWQDRPTIEQSTPDVEAWRARGIALVDRLHAELGDGVEVTPEFLDAEEWADIQALDAALAETERLGETPLSWEAVRRDLDL